MCITDCHDMTLALNPNTTNKNGVLGPALKFCAEPLQLSQ